MLLSADTYDDSPVFQTQVVHLLQKLCYLHDAILAAEEESSFQLGLITESVEKLRKAVIWHLGVVHMTPLGHIHFLWMCDQSCCMDTDVSNQTG